MSEVVERHRRKRKLGNGSNVLSLYLIQCLDGTRPACQMPRVESFDTSDSMLVPQFAKIKKPNTDEESPKSKFMSYGTPAQATIVRSQGSYLYDRQGNSYLDSVSGVSHVGHCHPRVTQTAQLQMARFGTGIPSFYLNEESANNSSSKDEGQTRTSRYAERLAETLPSQLDTILFSSSGSEANDLAIQMARSYTGNYDVVVFEDGFHGSLGLVSDVSPKLISRGGVPKKPWVHILPCPDTFRGAYLDDDPNAFERYFEDAKTILDEQIKNGRKIACLLTEPIFTFHSVLIPPAKYFQQICNYIREIGGLVIIDEVQTGLGRVGAYTWGFQIHDIVPDIMTTGKPLGNGHPLAVTITTKDISNSLGELKSMFNPTLAQEAIGNTVLDVMEHEELQENAWNVGNILIENVKGMMKSQQFIGAVRGMGLLIGIEFVWDRDTRAPAREVAQAVLYQMREQHIITAVEGKNQNIVFLIPPLCFSDEDAKKFTNSLKNILDDIGEHSRETICENISQGAERYSNWNNIPADYLNSCNPLRNDRGCPNFDQSPVTTMEEGHLVELDEDSEAGSNDDDDGSNSEENEEGNSYNDLD